MDLAGKHGGRERGCGPDTRRSWLCSTYVAIWPTPPFEQRRRRPSQSGTLRAEGSTLRRDVPCVDATLARREQRGDPIHDDARGGLGRLAAPGCEALLREL